MKRILTQFKIELKRRGISVDLLKIALANATACVLKEDWRLGEIIHYLLGDLNGKPWDYLLEEDKFLMNELKQNKQVGNLDWFLTEFLDEVERLYLD
ncbi:MAG: hypothetical protein ACTSWY_13495 [Promethearchaeota archaeon]